MTGPVEQREEWIDTGERLLKGGKLGRKYLRPDGEAWLTEKPVLKGAGYLGAVIQVTVKTEGDRESVFTGGAKAPKLLRVVQKADDPRVAEWLGQQEEARQEVRAARLLKKAKGDAPDLGDMTLREVRAQITKTFGQSRADWIASVVAYLHGALK